MPGDASGDDLLEAAGFDGAVEAENIDAPAVPAARIAVIRIVLRVVAVGLEVVDRRDGFTQAGDGGDHQLFIGFLQCKTKRQLRNHRNDVAHSNSCVDPTETATNLTALTNSTCTRQLALPAIILNEWWIALRTVSIRATGMLIAPSSIDFDG